jgi:hypothetical protein
MNANSIRPEDVEAAIADEQYFTAAQGVSGARHVIHDENEQGPLARITICVLTLKNGFTAVGVNEGPVSAENFRADLGREYARKQALEKVWLVLGYQLKEKLHQVRGGLPPGTAVPVALDGPKQYLPGDVWRVQVHTDHSTDTCEVALKMQDGTMHKVHMRLDHAQDLRGRSERDLHEYALQQANNQLQELYRTVRRVSPV